MLKDRRKYPRFEIYVRIKNRVGTLDKNIHAISIKNISENGVLLSVQSCKECENHLVGVYKNSCKQPYCRYYEYLCKIFEERQDVCLEVHFSRETIYEVKARIIRITSPDEENESVDIALQIEDPIWKTIVEKLKKKAKKKESIKKIMLYSVLLGFIILGNISCKTIPKPNSSLDYRTRSFYNNISYLILKGEYDKVINKLRHFILENQTYFYRVQKAYYFLGICYMEKGSYNIAFQYFNFLGKNAEDPYLQAQGLTYAGLICFNTARYSEAITFFNLLLKKYYDKIDRERILYYLYRCYIRLGDKSKANYYLARINKEFPNGRYKDLLNYSYKEFYVQCGVFRIYENATKLAQKLKLHNFVPIIKSSRGKYFVLLGPYQNISKANTVLDLLHTIGIEAIIK